MSSENSAVELAQLREQLNSIGATVDEIKQNVSQIMTLDRTIAEMGVRNEQSQREIATIWNRLDNHKSWTEHHDKESMEVRSKIDTSIRDVDSKFEAVVNKGRGAFWLAGIVISIVQVVMTTAIIWTFTHVSDADSLNRVQEYRIEQLEKKLGK